MTNVNIRAAGLEVLCSIKKLRHIAFILLIAVSCTQNDTFGPLQGDWQVVSKHHKAKYRVESSGESFSAYVLKYNDGTTRYTFDTKDTHYVFRHVMQLDATTGATKTHSENKVSVEHPHADTLVIHTTSNNSTTTEILYRL